MGRIAELTERCTMNFDDHILYEGDVPSAEVNGRELKVLEYLCSYPNVYKTIDDINHYLDEGCLSSSTVRGYVSGLMRKHPIFRQVIRSKRGSGYKYVGKKLRETEAAPPGGAGIREALSSFLASTEDLVRDYLRSVLYCPCKWGPYTYDETPQNANSCEGLLAILSAGQGKTHAGLVRAGLDALWDEAWETGLQSKSLHAATTIPTSMLLAVCSLVPGEAEKERARRIAGSLWRARGEAGWGLYVCDMQRDVAIGFTYWAVFALHAGRFVPERELQAYARELFRYENAFCYGRTIDDVNPRVPRLHATAMMYELYQLLTRESRDYVSGRYQPRRAAEQIFKDFDNSFYITEQEAVEGVDRQSGITVHTVNWNHMTMHYSLRALALAMENGDLPVSCIPELLRRAEKMLRENSEKADGRLYASGPALTLENGRRGRLIYPTMHAVMGLCALRNAARRMAGGAAGASDAGREETAWKNL